VVKHNSFNHKVSQSNKLSNTKESKPKGPYEKASATIKVIFLLNSKMFIYFWFLNLGINILTDA
jgi:hypothetical protein